MMENEARDLILVPKSKAEEFKRATDEGAQIEVINKIISDAKGSMTADLEALDEDAARFRGLLLGYKKAYNAVLDEHLAATYKVWEDIQAKLPDVKAMTAKLSRDLSEIKPELSAVLVEIADASQKIESINTYQLQRMVELVQAIERTDEKTRDILRLVLATPKAVTKEDQ